MKARLCGTVVVVLAVGLLAVHCEEQYDFTKDRRSWQYLRKRAGYYSHLGVWKGGFPNSARSVETESYTCTVFRSDIGYCVKWAAHVDSYDDKEVGNCNCSDRGAYCIGWECDQVQLPCTNATDPICAPVVTPSVTKCACEEPSADESHCQRWRCTEIVKNGVIETEHYTCLASDKSGKYCRRWTGDGRSSEEVESYVCECIQRRSEYCQHWRCRERTQQICSTRFMWCNIGIAVGLFGGLSSIFVAVGFAILYGDRYSTSPGQNSRCVSVLFIIALLLFIGVPIAGGSIGIGVVLSMWVVVAILVRFCVASQHRVEYMRHYGKSDEDFASLSSSDLH